METKSHLQAQSLWQLETRCRMSAGAAGDALGVFQQGDCPTLLHAETAGAVHPAQPGAGGPVTSDCPIPDLASITQPSAAGKESLPRPNHSQSPK
ncbi:hypothetical protein MHYP_G00069670 [Metynnis hypsauchen]